MNLENTSDLGCVNSTNKADPETKSSSLQLFSNKSLLLLNTLFPFISISTFRIVKIPP